MAEETAVPWQIAINSETNPKLPFPYTDIGLEVEDQILYVAKSILMDKSTVFKKMLEPDCQNVKTIHLPDKNVDDMKLFLKCLCPFIDHPVTADNVLQIVPLASEYDAQELITKCETVICEHCKEFSKSFGSTQYGDIVIDIRRVLDYIIACEKFTLNEKALQTVAEVASYIECAKLEALEDFAYLSDKTKLVIATKRLKKFEKTFKSYRDVYKYQGGSDLYVDCALRFLFQFPPS